jgi:4-amino-4-deoxy-L-arabinose transferase-like glycosyltransferase
MVACVPGSFRRGLLGLTLAGVAVRLLWVRLEPSTYPVADETMWLTWGARDLPALAFSPLRLRFIFHPPLYVYFIGVLSTAFGSIEAVKYAQALAGALLVPAVGLLGGRAFGEKAGLVAAGIAAFYPELVWFVSHFWAATVFTVLLWWAMERLVASDQDASTAKAAAAGILFGLTVLTRETVLYFLPLAALWLAWRRSGGRRRAAALLAAAFLVVFPWTVRNWRVFGAFVPVSTAGALNLWQGNTRLDRQQVYEEDWAIHGRIEKYRHERRRALESILERQPWWILEKLRDEMPAFWEAHGQPIVHLERGAYGPVRRDVAYVAIGLVLAPYLGVLVLFVLGVAHLPKSRAAFLVLAFLAYYVLLHVAAHGYPRYRLPVMPVTFLIAAQGVVAWRSRPRPRVGRRHLVAAAATGLVLALSVGPSLVAWVTRPWPPAWSSTIEGDGAGGSTADEFPPADEP